MSRRAHGHMRRSQVITTWGPGSLFDLPHYAVIAGGLDTWPDFTELQEIIEPVLCRKIQMITGVESPRLYAPPSSSGGFDPGKPGVGAWRFPQWFLVQEDDRDDVQVLSRRLVHRRTLDGKSRFEKRKVVPIRFVRACPKGHVDDIDWIEFVHGKDHRCRGQLWLDERGTTGELSDMVIRCECGKARGLLDATDFSQDPQHNPLGKCNGMRPWLGMNASEPCTLSYRLLIRTAANAYFPQIFSALSLPEQAGELQSAVGELWDDLQYVDTTSELNYAKKRPKTAAKLSRFTDHDILCAIKERKAGRISEKPVKLVELEALLAAPEGFGDDVPVNPNFHARRLPEGIWRKTETTRKIDSVIQVHRLREVLALIGFTRFEAIVPDIFGEYDSDVETASLAAEPQWFPAVENRGEGIFLQLKSGAVNEWLTKEAVAHRTGDLLEGNEFWIKSRNNRIQRSFPGAAYVLLHTLSHLLIQSLSIRCGYPASSIRERIYADSEDGRYGILLYTGSPDAEGTLGGLVQEARHIEDHLQQALRIGSICSNDPICSYHNPKASHDSRWLHGAACHACVLIAETSCEMKNDYLDRALVVPVLGLRDAAFFEDIA